MKRITLRVKRPAKTLSVSGDSVFVLLSLMQELASDGVSRVLLG